MFTNQSNFESYKEINRAEINKAKREIEYQIQLKKHIELNIKYKDYIILTLKKIKILVEFFNCFIENNNILQSKYQYYKKEGQGNSDGLENKEGLNNSSQPGLTRTSKIDPQKKQELIFSHIKKFKDINIDELRSENSNKNNKELIEKLNECKKLGIEVDLDFDNLTNI